MRFLGRKETLFLKESLFSYALREEELVTYHESLLKEKYNYISLQNSSGFLKDEDDTNNNIKIQHK